MGYTVVTGDAREALAGLDDGSVQLTVTSPPYFSQRHYTTDAAAEIGRERSVDEYVAHLVAVFDRLHAKTRDDGLLFLNLGDTYRRGVLLGVPWRVALALGERGWILRSDIIWKKPNAMPSAVKNRPTVEHEYVFMFAKSPKYYYNQDAVREPHVTLSDQSRMRGGRSHFGKRGATPERGKYAGAKNLHDGRWDQAFHPLGRNRRTVWDIPLSKFRDAHFAVFPERLVELCVLAGSREGSLVCDPFMGSGTTGVVALRLGRSFFGCDISPEYTAMATHRLEDAAGPPA